MSSQPGNSEVSKKLKLQAAIRAKLEELGVYVDDELPDYIMVMIANKKEKVQMKDALNLFIGKSTPIFVDWLFDLFDRLQNASKPGETSKKDEEKKMENDANELEEKQRREKEERDREQQKEKDREREKERERQKERDREKRDEEEKRREEKRKESQRSKRRRTRSRSNTYSDEEDRARSREKNERHHKETREKRGRSTERKRITHQTTESPERKLHSTVVVKRNIRPSGDSNVKARGSMFLRALNEASGSSNHGSSRRSRGDEEGGDDDDMSDVEALPTKSSTSPRKSVRERLSRVNKDSATGVDDDAVVLGNQPQTGGPQMILKLGGGREAIKRTRIQDRIVIDDSLRRNVLKRRVESNNEEPKSKHERIVFDVSRDSTPSDGSPTIEKWNGRISIGDDSDSDDEEAEIDAFVAEARGIARRDSVMEEEDELPPTHQLSGGSYTIQGYPQGAPPYTPTPLSVLQEQQNQQGGVPKEDLVRERCIFWPKCTKGEACVFMHPVKNCTNFPNCSYGIRCLFIHPACRFDRFCTKKHCPFTHYGTGGVQPGVSSEFKNPLTSNRAPAAPTSSFDDLPKPAARGALGSLAEKLAASIKKKAPIAEKKEEKTDENETEEKKETEEPEQSTTKTVRNLPDFRVPLQNMILCRYAAGCRNPVCHFKHPKECRFGANCRNSSCYFYHKPTSSAAPVAPNVAESGAAKYKWTATTAP